MAKPNLRIRRIPTWFCSIPPNSFFRQNGSKKGLVYYKDKEKWTFYQVMVDGKISRKPVRLKHFNLDQKIDLIKPHEIGVTEIVWQPDNNK